MVVIKAVEVFADLVAVRRIARYVNVDDDFFRRRIVRFEKQLDENFREFGQIIVGDAVFELDYETTF